MLSQTGNTTTAELVINVTSSVLRAVTSQSLHHSDLTTSMENIPRDKNETSNVISQVLSTRTPNTTLSPTPSTTLHSSLIPRLRFDGRDALVWRFANTGEMGGALLVLGLGAVVTVVIILGLVSCIKRKKHKYEKVPTSDRPDFEYIYKPLQGGRLDEEYENTFVGVSIPLLQDNTKV